MKRLLKITLWLLLTVVACGMWPEYQLQSWIDSDTHTIAGTMWLHFQNNQGKPLEELTFFLPANLDTEPNPYLSQIWRSQGYLKKFDSSHTYVVKVKVNGEDVAFVYESFPAIIKKYSLESVLLKVPLKGLLPNESLELELKFLTKIPHRHGDQGWSKEIIYWMCGFHPLLLDPQNNCLLPAYYSADILVPASLVVATNADYQSENSAGGIYKKVSLKNDTPSLGLALVAGSGLYVKEDQFQGIDIYTYYQKGHEKEAVFASKTAIDVLAYYNSCYGTYHRKRLLIVEGSSLENAYCAPGLICLPQDFYRYYNAGGPSSFDGLLQGQIAKELAKSWFDLEYDLFTPGSAWLEEALRHYMAADYFSQKGLAENKKFTDRFFFSFKDPTLSWDYHENLETDFLEHIFFPKKDEPLTRPYAQLEYPEVYEKRLETRGYLTLRTLASFLGKTTFQKLLREISLQNKAGYRIDNEMFASLATKLSGKSVTEFWQNWVDKAQYEDLQIKTIKQEKIEGEYKITAYLNSRQAVDWPVEMLWEFVDGSSVITKIDPLTEAVIYSQKPLLRATIDPFCLILDIERLNNSYPKKTELSIGKKQSLDTTRYSIEPLLRINESKNALETGISLQFSNRFYSGWAFSRIHSGLKPYSSLSFYNNFPNGKITLEILSPSISPEKFSFLYQAQQKAVSDIGYTAKHHINWFSESLGFDYYPKIKDYNLCFGLEYDALLFSGGKLNGFLELNKKGGKLSFGGDVLKTNLANGVFKTSFNVQTTFNEPLNKATNNVKFLPEQSGDYAVAVLLENSTPIVLDRELFRIGPLIWEDAEAKCFLASMAAWPKEVNPLSKLRAYLGAEFNIGFNFYTKPFALSVVYAKDLLGERKEYSSIRFSTRFYREVLGK